MSNMTVNPFGPGGSLPSGYPIADNLETNDAQRSLSAAQGAFLGTFLFGKDATISLSSITTSNYSLGATDWGGTSGTHKVVPVTPGERYTLKVTASSGNGGWYGLLTSSYVVPSSPSDSVPYVSGTGRVWLNTNQSVDITIPSGCAYLCICPKDGSSNTASWKLVKHYNDYVNTFMDKVNEIDGIRAATYTYILTPIDISGATSQKCSLGTTKWYDSSTYNPTHIAVPVSGIDTIELTLVSCESSSSFYTFVTSSYSPPVTNNANIPFATGLSERSSLNKTNTVTLHVPEDAAYLILTTKDGTGHLATWSVSEKTILTVDEAFREYCVHIGDPVNVNVGVPVRLKIGAWNVGNFSLGNSGDPSITPSNFDTMRSKWRTAINEIGVDVLGCCEYNTNFMNAQGGSPAVTARDAVFTDDVFAYAKIGPEVQGNDYMQTAIFANLDLESSTVVTFQHSVQQGRYYQVTETHLGGNLVKIVETHLDYSSSSSEEDSGRIARRQQINELITAFADDDYVIICGDFNVNHGNVADYDLFTAAGYKMANHGYLGNIATYPAGDSPTVALDNIVYKGFVANKVDVLNDATLSDHKCLFADLTMVSVEDGEEESE